MLDILFATMWIVVGFFAVRFAGGRFFHEKYQADIVAIAVVLAFAIGALWPFSNRIGTAPVAAPVAAAVCHSDKGVNLRKTMIRGIKPARGGDYGGSIDLLSSDPVCCHPATVFQAGCIIYATGWAANMAVKTPASGVVLVVDSERMVRAMSVYARPDLVKAFGASSMLLSGFRNAAIPTAGLGTGRHSVQLGALSTDGRRYHLIGPPTMITLR
ncbi:MAG: hypothetical protein ACYDB1_04200 [Acidiferrobacteraceae bacterium]